MLQDTPPDILDKYAGSGGRRAIEHRPANQERRARP